MFRAPIYMFLKTKDYDNYNNKDIGRDPFPLFSFLKSSFHFVVKQKVTGIWNLRGVVL